MPVEKNEKKNEKDRKALEETESGKRESETKEARRKQTRDMKVTSVYWALPRAPRAYVNNSDTRDNAQGSW